jgi:hypothetical protein
MENDKNNFNKKPLDSREEGLDNSSRARNRTVMLTPEVTGQVRALINQEETPPMKESGFAIPATQSRPANAGSRETFKSTSAIITPANLQSSTPVVAQTKEATRDNTATNAPIDSSIVQVARQQSVGVAPEKLTRLIGFMVSYDNGVTGEVLDLRVGRWIVSSEKSSEGNFLIVKHPTVSPLHAIIKISESKEIQVLDQLSENGTLIKKSDGKEEKLSGSLGNLEHGDVVKFGERSFNVCLIPGI